VAGAVVLMLALELLALDGRAFHHLGLSLRVYQPPSISNPLLLDTLAAMTLNGALFYALASVLDRRGTEVQRVAAHLMFLVSPFALLQPLGYLVRTGEYSGRYDWIYLGLAVTTALLSQVRQRRAFYYAGILNTGAALFLLADHRQWFDKPAWGSAVIAAGLVALVAGFEFDRRQRLRRGR
jgi:hypothetical protein